ncbi:MAG: hypothetical protein ACJATI_002606 [Halioglobus sp.]|jgi:uncharacterized protein (DUF885 family)
MLKILFVFCLLCSGIGLQGQSVADIIDSYENINSDETEEDEEKSPWPTFSLSKSKIEIEKLNKILIDVKSSKQTATEENDLINLDLLELIIEDKIFNLEFKKHEMPLSAEGGFLTGIIYRISGTRINSPEDGLKYLNKLKALPAYFDERIENLKAGQSRGVSSPKLIANLCLVMAKEVSESEANDNFFAKAVEGTTIEKKAIAGILTQVIPAYKKLVYYLETEYIPNAPQAIGVSSINGGKEYYEQRVRYYATEDISPQEVFDIGMSEVQRIRTEMDVIIDELEYEGSFADFCEFLRTDPQFYPKTGKELLHYAAWITKEMEGKLPDYFNKLPLMPLTVKPVPAALAPNYTTGRYSSGSYKNKKAGQYWVNTTSLESRPLYVLPSLSLHEGVPGHHTQIMLAAELDLPKFRKSQYLSAFGEGWALYCEYLGKEAGMYHTEYEEFGALVYEMWRACRLVVDPGMHYMGWSREKAFDFMKDNTALSLHEVGTEINRYIGWPGQAVSYKLGELKIRKLRKYAEKTLGDKFDIRAFHDKVLENGSIPMATLNRIVKAWVGKVLMG